PAVIVDRDRTIAPLRRFSSKLTVARRQPRAGRVTAGPTIGPSGDGQSHWSPVWIHRTAAMCRTCASTRWATRTAAGDPSRPPAPVATAAPAARAKAAVAADETDASLLGEGMRVCML